MSVQNSHFTGVRLVAMALLLLSSCSTSVKGAGPAIARADT